MADPDRESKACRPILATGPSHYGPPSRIILSMNERSNARLALAQEARFMRGVGVQGARRPAVRRYRLVRKAPLTEPVASRFALMRAHD